MDTKKHFSVNEVASLLNVSHFTVIDWIHKGLLRATRRGITPRSPFVISAEEVQRIQRTLNGEAS